MYFPTFPIQQKKKIGQGRLTQNETYSLSFPDVLPLFMGRIIPGDPKRRPPLLETRRQNNNNRDVKEPESNPWRRCRRMRNKPLGNDSKCSSFFFLGVAGRWAVAPWQRCHCQPVSPRSAERIIHWGLIRGHTMTRCLAGDTACASEYDWSTQADQVHAFWQRVRRMCRVSVLFRSIGTLFLLSAAQCDFNVLFSAL